MPYNSELPVVKFDFRAHLDNEHFNIREKAF